jgi:ferrous-iron efflux pump FieF
MPARCSWTVNCPRTYDRKSSALPAPRSSPGIQLHDIRTRQSGQTIMIQLHLELDDNIPLVRAHGIAKAVEKEILRTWPGADVIIHQDPVELARKTDKKAWIAENIPEVPPAPADKS